MVSALTIKEQIVTESVRHLILVTGGAGYIGSHVCVALLDAGFEILVLDDFSNSSPQALQRVRAISGRQFSIVTGDVRDRALLDQLFAEHAIAAVMHFAGLKAVGESCEKPLLYFDVNVAGSLNLCRAMANCGVGHLIFSSSATVYGEAEKVPIVETAPTQPTNPYGQSKAMVEDVLQSLAKEELNAGKSFWKIALLRYFNPAGAHPSGLIGEDPGGIPNNLLPFISQVAIGKLAELVVFGDDYATPDGTGVRDYIHVVDLAAGHVAALQNLLADSSKHGCHTWNLGTGQGYSVLEMVAAFEQASGVAVPYRVAARRPGDIAMCWADTSKAHRDLGWRAECSLLQMMEDTWRWQQNNPTGYAD